MKKFICGLLAGVIISGAGAYAVNEIYDNPYPILVNGEQKQIQGYNIDGYSYFKLRDIADATGNFNVDFYDDTIQIAKDGYVYGNIEHCSKIYSDLDWVYEYAPQNNSVTSCYKLPHFNINSTDANKLNAEIDNTFAEMVTDISDVESIEYDKNINGNILSLCIKISMTYNDVVEYITKNIDISTGNEVSNRDLITMANISEEDLLQSVRNTILQRLNEHLSQVSVSYEQAEDMLKSALSEFCYNIDKPMYINSAKHLVVIPHFMDIVGGYEEPLDTGFEVNI